MSRKVIGWSVAAIVAIVLIFNYLPSFVADSLYKNVDDITDGEMPATVTSFESGPDVVSTIGGSGEGLNCSLPALTNLLFDGSSDSRGRRHLVLQRFRQACVFHDLCYRHGLATYGYNQNDCDRILQNAAFRLCTYIRNGSGTGSATRCQTDSKMVLAGVSMGGYNAFRGWDRSTYFEFESDPFRSDGFQASRVVDHPFKAVDPVKYRDDPDQVILSFENVRSDIAVTCMTCGQLPVFEYTQDPNQVDAELRSVGVTKLPEALLKREPMLSETVPIWLPPRRHHAAPHVLVDAAGKDHLIWMSRNNPQDTMSCVVGSDAARLLTNTLPRRDLCSIDSGSSLTMVEVCSRRRRCRWNSRRAGPDLRDSDQPAEDGRQRSQFLLALGIAAGRSIRERRPVRVHQLLRRRRQQGRCPRRISGLSHHSFRTADRLRAGRRPADDFAAGGDLAARLRRHLFTGRRPARDRRRAADHAQRTRFGQAEEDRPVQHR